MGGIRITDTHMSSADTPHTATVTGGGWQVSWLPGRTLDRNQAITAMTIASTVGGTACPAPMIRSGCTSTAGPPN